MPCEEGERLTGKGAQLALWASELVDAILATNFRRKGDRRRLRPLLLENPLFAELRKAAKRQNVIWLAAELLKFYEQSLSIAAAREENRKTHPFWEAQQEIKRAILGDRFREDRFLGIFNGLDFLAGQKIHYGSELEREKLLAEIKEKVSISSLGSQGGGATP